MRRSLLCYYFQKNKCFNAGGENNGSWLIQKGADEMLVAFDVFEFISESEKAPNNDVLFFSMYTMLKPMYLTEKGTGSIANKRAARIVE